MGSDRMTSSSTAQQFDPKATSPIVQFLEPAQQLLARVEELWELVA